MKKNIIITTATNINGNVEGEVKLITLIYLHAIFNIQIFQCYISIRIARAIPLVTLAGTKQLHEAD